MTGERLTAPPFPAGTVTGTDNDYAWLFEWSDTYAPKALYMIQSAGLLARVATAPFNAVMSDGRKKSFGYGTIMVQQGEKVRPAGAVTAILRRLQGSAIIIMVCLPAHPFGYRPGNAFCSSLKTLGDACH
jgi:hypothetical protein